MTQTNEAIPSFNLWTEAWITLEDARGELSQNGIRDALVNAHEYIAIYDPSPLVVAGVHRLLTAILQDALQPEENADLERLWGDGGFPADEVDKFGKRYANRFDLFSKDKPFFQSADLPMFPDEKERKASKSVAQLFPEIPAGKSLVTHYRHTIQDEQVFSPASVAAGLVTMPPFISSGGAGLMPSINGVPPIYVLPGGKTLFESLAASLLSSKWLDAYQTADDDQAWWKRPAPIAIYESKKKQAGMSVKEHRQLSEVGYLHGLTFPARKVRMHPERLNTVCARSGQQSEWCVRTMAFRMGESILENVEWQDPFAAYKLPVKQVTKRKSSSSKKNTDRPKPIRPMRTRAVWREFSGLFLQKKVDDQQTRRPLFLNQFAQLEIGKRFQTYPFRCVAWQTDGKMKFFEWMDFGFDIPPSLLQDPNGAQWAEQALSFATDCCATITRVFSSAFGRKTKNAERFKRLKGRLEADYWAVLADKFRQFVLDLDDRAKRQQTLEDWYDTVGREAQNAFDSAADATGDDGNSLLTIERGKNECRKWLSVTKNKIQSNKKEVDDAQKRT
jgi:CRISPR system Cascade subunit CasA